MPVTSISTGYWHMPVVRIIPVYAATPNPTKLQSSYGVNYVLLYSFFLVVYWFLLTPHYLIAQVKTHICF